MTGSLLIYGATGYTGQLLAEAAGTAGLRPVLAARNEAKLRPLADRLGLDWRLAALDDSAAVDRMLTGIAVVLNAAGPFSATARPMADACLRSRAHYLDITGEIDVIEGLAARDGEAAAAGVMLLPGVGFDVVPSDCLAAHLAHRMPDAVRLTIAIAALAQMSRGTLATGLESIGTGTRVRRGGRIVELDPAPTRDIDYGDGPSRSIAISWGDVASAYHSTGIPDITVFFRATRQLAAIARLSGSLRRVLASRPAQHLLRRLVRLMPAGPDEDARRAGRAVLVGEVEDDAGRTMRTRLETPEGYALTVKTALTIAGRVLAGEAHPGFRTPSLAFGPDLILTIPGVRREDL